MIGLQDVANGVVLGATIGLGAIGVTLTYAVLRFANFTHGELLAWGAYVALAAVAGWTAATGAPPPPLGPFTFGWPLLAALVVASAAAGGLALVVDRLLFGPLRRQAAPITMVIASFGASLALRNLLVVIYGPQPQYFSREIAMARPVLPGVRLAADQLFLLGLTAALVLALHLVLSRTTLGRAMRGFAENPALAQVVGIDPRMVVRATWLIGGGLAAVAGVLVGVTVQVRVLMGGDLLLPLFAAAILGGIGSAYGAVLGGLVIGIAEALAVPLVGAEYRAAVAFLVLLTVLLIRPAGLLGRRS